MAANKSFQLCLCLIVIFYVQSSLAILKGKNLMDCVSRMSTGDWCELSGSEPSTFILSKSQVKPYIWGSSGSKSVINAWTGMATDGRYYYLTGGGHGDYGGNEVYRYDPIENIGKQLTQQSKLSHWFIRGKNEKGIEGNNRYCRTVNTYVEPSSTHTYDGIEYSKATNELIVSVYGAANHSCVVFNIKKEPDRYKEISKNLIPPVDTGGVYALNFDTLVWRKIYTSAVNSDITIRTELRGDGLYFFGNRVSLNYGHIALDTTIKKQGRTANLPSSGDGVLVWDKARNKFWSEHGSVLYELDSNGRYLKKHHEPPPKQDWRGLVIDESNNQLVKWDGANKLQIFTPETGRFCNEINLAGRKAYSLSKSTASWTARMGQLRVYTKFKYIERHDVFIGVSEFNKPFLVHKRSHTCGVKKGDVDGTLVSKRFVEKEKVHQSLAQRVKQYTKEKFSFDAPKSNNKRKGVHNFSVELTTTFSKTGIPYGDLIALQSMGLLPKYGLASHSVNSDLTIDWSGTGGERDEIGLFPEQHAAFIAGKADLQSGILQAALAPPPLKFDHAHHPNEFWLPYLLTGNPLYIANMEAGYVSYKKWRSQPLDSAIKMMTGREGAWNLRDLAQLAYLEGKGLTKETVYISALDATRDRWLGIIANPRADQAMFNIFDFNSAGANTHGFTGWMQAMLGQAINYTALITKDLKWVDIATWHFQHLLKSSGDKWPLKAVGYNHVFMVYFMPQGNQATWREAFDFAQTATWESVSPYPPYLVNNPIYQQMPDDHIPLVNVKVGSYPLTYANRAQYAYGWAALACKNSIARACGKGNELFDEITLRGDRWGYKNGVISASKQGKMEES